MVQVLPVTKVDPNNQPAPLPAVPTNPNLGQGGVVAPPVDTRSLYMSQTPQTGYIQGFDTQNNFAPVYVKKGQYVAGISATNKDLTPSSFNNVSGYTLPNGQQGTQADADAMLAGIKAAGESQAAQKTADLAANPPPTKEANDFQNILNNMVTGAQEAQALPGQQLAAEQAGGIPQLNQQKAQIDTQIAQKIAESQALDSAYEAANHRVENQAITNFSMAGEKNQIYRNYLDQKNALAASAGLLQAQSLGLNGQIQVAQATADRAIDLKYKQQELQQSTYEMQLKALRPTLDAQEKRQADLQQARIDKEKQEMVDKKQKEKDIQSLVLDAVKAGITDQNILTKIGNAKTADEALLLYAKNIPLSAGEHSSIYKEWQDYVSTGGKLSFDSYQTMDANRKRNITNISMGQQELNTTKSLIPGINAMLKGEKMLGSDGYISPKNWNVLKSEWVSRDGDAKTFDVSFSYLQNPNQPIDSAYTK